ncbi:MAG: hypothetical protein FWH11_10005 [Micrococcales bacterium]|nr:hypothetical protein [Micrococcales bacterium]
MWNDVEALRSIARSLQEFADSVGRAANDAQASDPGWISDAADNYQSRIDQAVSTLRTRSQEISEASTAMFAYADAVEDHIGDIVALANTLGKGVDYVWNRLQEGASDVVDFLGDMKDGAEDVLASIGRAASGPINTIRGWL